MNFIWTSFLHKLKFKEKKTLFNLTDVFSKKTFKLEFERKTFYRTKQCFSKANKII